MPRPVLNLTTGPNQYKGTLLSAVVIQSEYAIDGCVISIPRLNANTAAFATGTPIQFVYGRTPSQTATYTGYVHHIEPNREIGSSVADVVCLGASAPMLRDAANRVWPVGSDAAAAIQAIANTLHLSSITETAEIPAPGGPVNESWWRYIVRAAKRSGFTCYVAGTDLRFHSRRINASGDTVPWFQSYDTPIAVFSNIIRSYHAIDSDDIASESLHRQRRAWGVTDTGLIIRFTDSDDLESVGGITQPMPTLTKNENMVIHDFGTAQSRLSNIQETTRFTRLSEFIVSGDETVTQAGTVVMRGISASLDGYWYVTQVSHHISSDAYSCHIEAGRDGAGDNAPADLTAVASVIDLGRREPGATPPPVLRVMNPSVTNQVFPSAANQQWTASTTTHRTHYPWRAAVRG